MGKRELLLIIGFVIVGAVVYQATAPPPGPDDRGFSFSRLLEAARRHVTGNRAAVELTRNEIVPVAADVNEVRITGFLQELQIEGQDRADIETSLRVNSRAYDDNEARQFAGQTILKTDRTAYGITFSVDYPKPGQQRAFLTLRVPSRLRIRVENRPSTLTISKVSTVEALNAGGATTINNISGRVAVTHRGGKLTIDDVASLKLTGRASESHVRGVRGDATIALEQGGELMATGLAGAVDVDARNAEVTLQDLETTKGPIRVSAMNGVMRLSGIKTETRVDGRNAEIDLVIAAAAPIAIYNEGEGVSLTPPAGGYRLDAVAIDGHISSMTPLKNLGLDVSTTEDSNESRASGNVRGGGPTITIRVTRGSLSIRDREKDKGTK